MQRWEKKLYFIFLCLCFFLTRLKIVKNQNAVFSCETSDFNLTRCTFSGVNGAVRVSTSGLENLTSVYFTLEDELHYFYVDTYNVFQALEELTDLKISIKHWVFSLDLLKNWERLKANLFFLKKLESLIINGTNFNSHRHAWRLPPTLKKLIIINCNYTEFDLSTCPNLEYVDLSDNPLTKIPIFSNPEPPLGTIILLHNPFYNFTVDDVAGLCKVKQFQLGYYSMGSHHRQCECQRLSIWANETGISTNDFNCGNSTIISSKQCAKYDLEGAFAIGHKCLHGTLPSNSGRTLFIVSMVFLILATLIAAGVYVYFLKIRKRKRIRKSSHRSSSLSTTPKSEDVSLTTSQPKSTTFSTGKGVKTT